WWAGGFGVLDSDHGLDSFLIERGATVDVHAAARIGMPDRLETLISADPSLVRARGGDGQTPLHFAANVEVARYLLDHGAEIDALDVDHESTPAQWMIRDRQPIVHYLVSRGCRTDLLMAAALGDLALVRKHLAADPGSIHMRTSREYFPMRDHRAGGSIYNWTLGFDKAAHVIAHEFGHEDVVHELMEQSPPALRFSQAAEMGDEATVHALLAEHPDLVKSLPPADERMLADAARDNRIDALRLMLAAGWPVNARGQHHATPLHWAAWIGHTEMVRELLRHNAPIEDRENDYQGSPLDWAVHASKEGWHPDRGDYVGTVEALLQAGAKAPAMTEGSGGSEAVRELLLRYAAKSA
ncbi:MAG: ankyrin repeat domain-containing protein, partial [Gemmatimonadaceae bacterium]